MVDNENQWEDMEYSDNGDDGYEDSYTDEEYSDDQEYEYEEEYDEDEEYEPQKKSGNPIFAILLLLILLGAGGFIAYSKFMPGAESDSGQSAFVAQQDGFFASEEGQSQDSNNDLADSFFAEAGGDSSDMMSVDFNSNGETNVTTGEGFDASVATVSETAPSEGVSESDLFENQQSEQDLSNETLGEENNSIMVTYNKAARINPFKPPVVDMTQSDEYNMINNTDFEIIEPPAQSFPDENLTRLLQTQISGILFDEENPSAIVNLNGLDHFVKVGDVVSGYTIDSITRDKVQVSYKDNSYVASVGELFTRGSLDKQRAVVNLEQKFAGRYKNNN